MSVPFWVAFGGALLLWLRACPSVGQQTLPAAVTPPGGEWMSGYEERPTSKRALLQRGGASSIIVKRHGLDAGRRESSRAAVRELLAVGGTFAARLHQDSLFAFSGQVKGHEDAAIAYVPMSSSKARCRLQNYEEKCETDSDQVHPKKGLVFAGTDTPYTLEEHEEFPSHQVYPVAAAGIAVVINLPGAPFEESIVIVNMTVLASIFTGKINNWRDPTLLELNSNGLADYLPNETIKVFVREESSGTTEVFKRGLSDYAEEFELQRRMSTLEIGGPKGFPSGNGEFHYRRGNEGIAFAVRAVEYSIGYTGHREAALNNLQMAVIKEDCVGIRLTLDSISRSVEHAGLPEEYHGVTEAEKGLLLKEGDDTGILGLRRESYTWPFVGYTYMVIRTETDAENNITCLELEMVAEYLSWFYTSDITAVIGQESQQFVMLGRHVQEFFKAKLDALTCDGRPLIKHRMEVSNQLSVDVLVSSPWTTSRLLLSYFNIYRVDDPQFKAIHTINNTVDQSALGDTLDSAVSLNALDEEEVDGVLHVPWLMSGVAVLASLPGGVQALTVDLETLYLLLTRSITHWNDPRMVDLNPSLEQYDEEVHVFASKEVKPILDAILAKYRAQFDSGSAIAGDVNFEHFTDKVMAFLTSQDYSLVLVPAFEHSIYDTTAVMAGIVSPSDTSRALLPNMESFQACIASDGTSSHVDIGNGGCYPLAFRVDAIMKKTLARDASGLKAARFWYWMLQNSSSINDSNPGLVQIFAASTPEHKRKMGERFLELRYSDGQTPVFRRRSNALSIQDYALIGLGALGLVLVCGVAAVLRYYSHKRHLINIAGFASKISDFDTESPALKAIKYLERTLDTRRANKDEATTLLVMLKNSPNLEAPDMLTQVEKLRRQRRASNPAASTYTEDLERYVMQLCSHSPLHDDMKPMLDITSRHTSRNTGLVHVTSESFTALERTVKASLTEMVRPSNLPEADINRLYPLLEVLSQSMFCNVIHLTNLSGNRPLSTVFLALIHHEKLVELLQLNRPKLVRFIVAIEDQYMDNPFHNRVLAAFAVHRTYSIMRRLNLGQTSDARIYMLTAMIAAAIAKVGYAGRDNSFLQRAEDPVARQFNDHSPNENNALRISLELMRQPDTNIFEFSEMDHPSKRRMIKKYLINAILSLDPSKHFDTLLNFQRKFSSHGVHSKGHAVLLLQVVVKAAWLSHYSARMEQHLYWCKCLEDELFLQGDAELELGMEVSSMMDRRKPGFTQPKTQAAFFSLVVLPVYHALAEAYPAVKPLLLQAEANHSFWSKRVFRDCSPFDSRLYLKMMTQNFEVTKSLRDFPGEAEAGNKHIVD